MKGIVFTELLELIEQKFGYELVDTVLDQAQLPSGGAYTAVGSYDHSELVELLRLISEASGVSVNDLMFAYGRHLFAVFATGYPEFFEKEYSSLEFLGKIEDKIHPQVQKLYPDAELPKFIMEVQTDDRLVMTYVSARRMGSFAEGLIYGCMDYFKEQLTVKVEAIDDGNKVRFTIYK